MADGNGRQGERARGEAGPGLGDLRPRQVRSAAKMLQKEARRILKRHAGRIAAEPAEAIRTAVAAIDTHLHANAVADLQREAERIDELLHRHASFARKSAFREVLENVSIAVVVALGARACLYEPFKIPSGSMIPTLVEGDHIFVNKFIYGVQIPFTSTVVGKRDGDIERGDVIVFRFPLDESEDFIKRVIGLPGDEVKVQGRTVAIKRAGEPSFEVLDRRPLGDACLDADEGPCELFEETLGDRRYVVRYMSTGGHDFGAFVRDDVLEGARLFKVPAGHLFVMGDNRDRSQDSRGWFLDVEAVAADRLVSVQDLRDVTTADQFNLVRPEGDDEWSSDPKRDRIVYTSSHRSLTHDLGLAVWRNPPIEARALFEALAAARPGGRPQTIDDLLAEQPQGARRDRMLQIGGSIDALVVEEGRDRWTAVFFLEPARTVFELACGRDVCTDAAALAGQIADVLTRFEKDHGRDARDLLERPHDVRYGNHSTNRHAGRDHFHEVVLAPVGALGPQETVRLRVFRKPELTLDRLRDAAFREVGRTPGEATPLMELGADVSLVEGDERISVIAADRERDMMFVLDCGRERCKTAAAAEAVAKMVWDRLPPAAADRRRLRRLLGPEDVSGTVSVPVTPYVRDPYDRVSLEATVQGEDHGLELEVWRQPAEGLAAKVAGLREQYGLAADDSVHEGGARLEEPDAFHYVFGVPESETVIRLQCRKGLCETEGTARELAVRAAASARDPRNFVDHEARRSRPYVPRGNVKGRAERIWYPAERFWLRIR